MPIFEQTPHSIGFEMNEDSDYNWVRFDLYHDLSIEVDSAGSCPLGCEELNALQMWLESAKRLKYDRRTSTKGGESNAD